MASSDSTIRNVYRQVTGQEADDSVLRSARSVPDESLASFFSGGGADDFAADPQSDIEKIITAIKQSTLETSKFFEEQDRRAGEFEEKNPFLFDEALARASAEERFDPFYDAELGEFMTGITRQKERSTEDAEVLRKELTTQTEQFVGRAGRDIKEALESSREGFAGAGLFFSGKRLKREGDINIAGEEGTSDFLRRQKLKQREGDIGLTRGLEDISLRETTARRRVGAARETDILTDVAGQRKEELGKREFARQQFIGSPLSSGTSGINAFLGV
ncbi:MAG TPA: hypothetical protein ENI23_11535 [bacterium]|nr:hypothetical protein [bacterium]